MPRIPDGQPTATISIIFPRRVLESEPAQILGNIPSHILHLRTLRIVHAAQRRSHSPITATHVRSSAAISTIHSQLARSAMTDQANHLYYAQMTMPSLKHSMVAQITSRPTRGGLLKTCTCSTAPGTHGPEASEKPSQSWLGRWSGAAASRASYLWPLTNSSTLIGRD